MAETGTLIVAGLAEARCGDASQPEREDFAAASGLKEKAFQLLCREAVQGDRRDPPEIVAAPVGGCDDRPTGRTVVPAIVIGIESGTAVVRADAVDAVASEIDVRRTVEVDMRKPHPGIQKPYPTTGLAQIEIRVAHDPRTAVLNVVIGVRILRWDRAGVVGFNKQDIGPSRKLLHRTERHFHGHCVDEPETLDHLGLVPLSQVRLDLALVLLPLAPGLADQLFGAPARLLVGF